jgi:pyridoxamine 5'-phosphate oxidase
MEITAHSNPLNVLNSWMEDAHAHEFIREPTAMALATLGEGGFIHNRIVLCKDWNENGLTFYTNYLSQKGRELSKHPFAGGVFYWDPLHRQVRVSGRVRKISAEDSRAYWRGRPRDSQISQYISMQSEVLNSREELELKWREAEAEFAGREVPCPDHWGGYVMELQSIEFWVGRRGRLHDRFAFELTSPGRPVSHKSWTFRRLYP